QGIAYSSGSMKLTSMISGQIDLLFDSAGLLMPQVKAGKLRALGVTSAHPSALAPGLPSLAETGLPGYEVVGSTGMFVLSKVPQAIVKHLNEETVRFLKSADAKAKLENAGAEVVANSPSEFAALISAEQANIAKMVQATGIRAQ